jgi:hypothetical protein
MVLGLAESVVLIPQVSVFGDILDLLNEKAIEHASLLLVHVLVRLLFVLETDLGNLGKKFYCFDSGAWRRYQVSQYFFHQVRLKDISQRDPRQEGLESFQALPYESLLDCLRIVDCLRDHELTKLEDRLEFRSESLLELLGLISQYCVFAKIENFLTQKFQDVQNIFTLGLRLISGGANIGDKVVPADSPLLLNDGDES